jgi:hypothetical protein
VDTEFAKRRKKLGSRSFWVSLVLLVVLVFSWVDLNRHEPDLANQLVSQPATEMWLQENWRSKTPLRRVKTGFFIQSLKFYDSNEVHLTGYIWQKYNTSTQADIVPPVGKSGFILPEQVDSGAFTPVELYRREISGGDEILIGWYFEATLRQFFNYFTYPFDHKTVWVRMWHRKFTSNVVLVPDFESYSAYNLSKGQTKPQIDLHESFGYETDIVLGAWEIDNTYFDYRPSGYDTNFGVPDYVGQKDFPELRYNFVIKRKFENAFIVHLLPLFVVAALLFGVLLTISDKPDEVERHGFTTSSVIGACSALFFVALLAHIELREQFAGSRVVFMELFYFFMYAVLVIACAYAYLFADDSLWLRKLVGNGGNSLVKAAYWPFLLLVVTLISLSMNVYIRFE